MRTPSAFPIAVTISLALSLAACTSPERPYQFSAPHGPDALDVAARTLARAGLPPESIDRTAGILTTQWKDTYFNYGQIAGHEATLVERYIVTVAPGGASDAIMVRLDMKQCARQYFGTRPCAALDGLLERHQKELDQQGAAIQAAIAQPR